MKIAIPTNDKIVVSDDPRKSGYFKIVTLKGEDIISDEFRSNPLRDKVLFSQITSREADQILTLLSIITTAVQEYNNSFLYNERNTCCSPELISIIY